MGITIRSDLTKVHLGTRELFTPNNKPTGRYLGEDQFDALIATLRKKFPYLRLV